MVPAAPRPDGSRRRRSRRHRWWAIPLAVIGLAPLLVVIVASFVPATALVTKRNCVARAEDGSCSRKGPQEAVRYAVVPADASAAGSRLTVTGLKEYDSSGHILFVTVREPQLSVFEWFLARNNAGTSGLYSFNDLYANVSPTEDREIAFRDMRNAKNDAYFVALSKLGYPVELHEGPAVVERLSCLAADDRGVCTERTDAADVLAPNDRITSIDGQPVNTLSDLNPLTKARKPGDTITIEFDRNGTTKTGEVQLIAAPDDGRPLIGIQMADTRTITIPNNIKIDFRTEDIGGPSAGLSFTLTLIDRLSQGDLTGGKRVAVTGTIDVDGNVGAIGGLQSKASAVRQEGVQYFIVPFDQGPEDIAAAQKAAGPGVQIIPVKTLDEALDALHRLGGDQFFPPPQATTGAPNAGASGATTTTAG